MNSATANEPNDSANTTIKLLERTIDCIKNGHLDKASYLAIQDHIKTIANKEDCCTYFASPSREDFMRALDYFVHDDDSIELELSLPNNPFPICLVTDETRGVSVILLVTLRAPVWIYSTGKDGEDSYFDSSHAMKATTYTVAGNIRSCGEPKPHMKENGRIIGDILLRSVLPLGELYVLPTWHWRGLKTQPPGSFQLPSEARSGFFAVLYFRGENWSSPTDIWAIWNYHPDRMQNSIDNSLDLNPWCRDDLLLTLLRNESAVDCKMREFGVVDNDSHYHDYNFDFMPLLDIYDKDARISSMRALASERGQMVRPVLKAVVPFDSAQPCSSSEHSGQSDDEVEDGGQVPTATRDNLPQVSGHASSPRLSRFTSLHEDEEMHEECEMGEAQEENNQTSEESTLQNPSRPRKRKVGQSS